MPDLSRSAIYCCDIGSVRSGAFGWARVDSSGDVLGDTDIDRCRTHVARDMAEGLDVALGIEAPLFLPVPQEQSDLSRGREGERDRSCFAPTGGYVTTLGLHELAYLFQGLPDARVTLSWTSWASEMTRALLVWEAFVFGTAHTDNNDHAADAATACVEFWHRLERGELTSDVTIEPPRHIFSIVGAAMLWAGLSTQVDVLHRPTLVIKPKEAYTGPITTLSGSA